MSDRLARLRPADLDSTQQAFYDDVVANEVAWAERSGARAVEPDGRLLGPFNPLLYNPTLGAALIGVFRADKASSSLSPRVHEIVVLTVGAVWAADYELYAHRAVARRTGLPDAVVEAIAAGQAPDLEHVSAVEASAHHFTWELTHDHRVAAETYDRAVRVLGDRGVVDLVLLVGLYLATCSIINAFEIAVPDTGATTRGDTDTTTVDVVRR